MADDLIRIEKLIDQDPTPERVCTELAKLLNVKSDEVALLRAEREVLKFLFPPGLKTAGSIPLSSSAVAARTAVTKTTMLSNTFAKVKHAWVFEGVKSPTQESNAGSEPTPIQKMMSVPVLQEAGPALGVIQVSRKGIDGKSAGPDFTGEDLRKLEQAAAVIAKMSLMRDSKETQKEN